MTAPTPAPVSANLMDCWLSSTTEEQTTFINALLAEDKITISVSMPVHELFKMAADEAMKVLRSGALGKPETGQ